MAFAPTTDGALYYETTGTGSGDPLVFIPGFGGVGAFWHRQVAHFSKTHTVMTVDHRGAGQSVKSRIRYSIQQMAEDVLTVLDHAGIARATLIGHSTGGAITQWLAIHHPTRVGRAVLSSTWCRQSVYFRQLFLLRRGLLERGDQQGYHEMGTMFRYPPYWLEAHPEAFKRGADADAEIHISRMNALIEFDLSADVHHIKAPTLVVVAEDDVLTPRYLSDDIVERLPHAEYVVMERGGHFCPEIESETYNPILERFFAKG